MKPEDILPEWLCPRIQWPEKKELDSIVPISKTSAQQAASHE